MVVELAIFSRDQRLKKCRWYAVVRQVEPTLYKEAFDQAPIAIEDSRGIFLRGIFQLLQRRQGADHSIVEPEHCTG